MKKFNILIVTSVVALLSTGCVKPVEDPQAVYSEPTTSVVTQSDVYQPAVGTSTGTIYEEVQPAVGTSTGIIYEEVQPVITTGGYGEVVTSNTGTTYPDPYANAGTGTVYNDPYAGQPVISDYPSSTTTTSYPAASTGGQGGGIHLQIAALKDYYTAEDYKNRLSLAPGLSAYVQRGAMNKVIVSGIPSIAEANRLKESRFPGAFIVHGASSGGYTPPVQPNYSSTSGGAYNVNTPYGSASSSTGSSGVGVQIAALGSKGKAQSLANRQSGKYPATVKKIGKYYKVILTGFSSRSAAKAHAGRVGGFVVNY